MACAMERLARRAKVPEGTQVCAGCWLSSLHGFIYLFIIVISAEWSKMFNEMEKSAEDCMNEAMRWVAGKTGPGTRLKRILSKVDEVIVIDPGNRISIIPYPLEGHACQLAVAREMEDVPLNVQLVLQTRIGAASSCLLQHAEFFGGRQNGSTASLAFCTTADKHTVVLMNETFFFLLLLRK